MVVWQTWEEQRAEARVQPSGQVESVLRRHSAWQPSRRTRLVVVDSLAVAGVLASSYLIFALKL